MTRQAAWAVDAPLRQDVSEFMLPERIRQLLCAYVDGELTARQCEAVRRLLQQSPEARALLSDLQADAGKLRGLPRRAAARDLSREVMRRLGDVPAPVRVRVPALSQRTLPAWFSYPSAAAVLAAVFFGSYFYFLPQRTNSDAPAPAWARIDSQPPAVTRVLEPTAAAPEESAPNEKNIAATQAIEPPRLVSDAPEVETPSRVPAASPPAVPKPPKKQLDGVFTTPAAKRELFELVDGTVGVPLALCNLDQQAARQNVLRAFKPDESYRLEITSSCTVKAVDAVTKAFQAKGVRVVADDFVAQRSKQVRSLTDYAIFADDLTPAEVVDLLARLGMADRQADAKRMDAARFHDLVILPLTSDDHKEAARLLGSESSPFTSAGRSSGSTGSLRQALLISYNPARPLPGASKEIKSFVEARGQRRPGTVQVFVVLRAVTS